MPFQVEELSIQLIEALVPLMPRIKQRDKDLENQLRRAASSIGLNVAEAALSDPGNKRARLFTAAGSAGETQHALRQAVAWRLVTAREAEAAMGLVRRVVAILWRDDALIIRAPSAGVTLGRTLVSMSITQMGDEVRGQCTSRVNLRVTTRALDGETMKLRLLRFSRRALILCGAVLMAGCGRKTPATPAPSTITYKDAQYICGRVSGTRQETSVETRGQKRVAAVALLTSSAGVAGTLATGVVGIKDKSANQTPTLITGAISVAVTAATAAVATYLTGSDDTKVQGPAIAETKKQADAALADLDTACAADPNSLACSYAAARAKGKCDAQAKSLPFEP